MNMMLALVAVYIHTIIYADDGKVRYVPKRQWFNTKVKLYPAYLKAWMTHKWSSVWRMHKQWNQHRRLKRILTLHKILAQEPAASQGHCETTVEAHEAIMANEAAIKHQAQGVTFDTGSKSLGIDNRAPAFISGYITDFEAPLPECHKVVMGFGGVRVGGVQRGIAVIRLEDDQGVIHKFDLPNSYYVPGTKDRLLSPQHFAQEMKKQKKGVACEDTLADKVILTWSKWKIQTYHTTGSRNECSHHQNGTGL
jgi:hypothetical protein